MVGYPVCKKFPEEARRTNVGGTPDNRAIRDRLRQLGVDGAEDGARPGVVGPVGGRRDHGAHGTSFLAGRGRAG